LQPFTGSFTQQEVLDEEVIAAATEVLRSGRLHRYNTVADELSQASQLEQAFAAYQGARYCLACASGGYAMAIALRGVRSGNRDEPVLTNGFTLAPVPGAIAAAGGKPVLVEITEEMVIDLEDLERKARLPASARFLLLSNMRGHLADMDRLSDIVREHGLILIEDCAHTMGASWNGVKSGNFGSGGLLLDPDLQASQFRRRRICSPPMMPSSWPAPSFSPAPTCFMSGTAPRHRRRCSSGYGSRPPICQAAWTIFAPQS
jgi:dTDP-4-amino-4,6-dideoxygalactose transaminase